VIAGVIGYVVAVVLVLLRLRYPEWQFWPIEPVIVFAPSVIGWMHVKKYSELGAAYTVAAHEIGLITPKLDDIDTEAQFSDFVNDAELAFSIGRPNTAVWMAPKRQKVHVIILIVCTLRWASGVLSRMRVQALSEH